MSGAPEHYYIGMTHDLRARLQKHNADEVSHASKFKPWTLKTYVAFSGDKQAVAFEKYLKSPSGRAFAKKRLWSRLASPASGAPNTPTVAPAQSGFLSEIVVSASR